MRILVCGSRHLKDEELVYRTLDAYRPTYIIHGNAAGADDLAGRWAEANEVRVMPFPADWGTFDRAAGPIRNKQMLQEGKPDLVIAFLATNSRGTANMIQQATKAGIPTRIVNIGTSTQSTMPLGATEKLTGAFK